MLTLWRTKTIVLGAALLLAACGGDDDNTPNQSSGELSDGEGGCEGTDNCINLDITEDTHLTAGTWTLAPKTNESPTYVVVKAGVTLTIDPGTTIQGQQGSALIVVRGATILAEGTASAPIVFTSARDEGERSGGDWGGLLILGAAPVNEASSHFEALPAVDSDGDYGGTSVDDNSGVIRYVRIEFAGYTYAADKEFNALTLCGVGRGTEIDYIQTHRGSDDGVELFGGTADLKHIVSSQNQDDGFDTDFGWQGRAQYVVVQHINGQSADPNGYESDNRPDGGNYDATPRTQPTIYNATLIGSAATTSSSRGAVLRRGTAGAYWNHIFVGFKTAAIDVRDAATTAGFPGLLSVQHSVFFNNGADGVNWQDESSSDNDAGFVEAAQFLEPTYANSDSDPGLPAAATSVTVPSFKPATTIVGATPPADGFFDSNATFVGAIGLNDWTVDWTAYPQN